MSVPSKKATKYDRQLRLWGDHGQTSLESAHVCLINASATGTEIVKNLVLPGIGGFTIVDNKRVSPEDVGTNFFVTADTVGFPRAQVAVALLQELNPDVKGAYIDDDFKSILETTPDFFTQFTVVIATDLSDEQLLMLAQLLWKLAIPLLIARVYGLVGYLRIAVPHHEVVESHPDNYHEDLRLECPFPGLLRYMGDINMHALDNAKHGNVPYLAVLFKYLEEWRASHGGEIPKNYREKKEFKELIRSGIRKNEDGVPLDEDNFDEAIQNVNSNTRRATELIQSTGALVHFLPPYSPDLSPVEELFSKVKVCLRENDRYIELSDDRTLLDLVYAAFSVVTSDDCLSWFVDCGYT